jgi:hypothetical protein
MTTVLRIDIRLDGAGGAHLQESRHDRRATAKVAP